MEFSAKTNTSEEWKAIISAISTLVEEATFEATVEGVSFRGMDPSHVALIDISWPNSAFEKYSCDGDIKFGVRIDEFSKLIKRAEKSDGVEINISDDSMLHVSIGKNKKYKMRLIESSASDTPLPKISYDSKITLSSSRLDKILGDIDVVSDYLSIKTTQKNVEFSGKGDAGEATINLEKDMEDVEDISVSQESSGTYSLEYLDPIVKAVGGTADSIICEFSSEKPLRIEFKVTNIGRIHFYLAPRVES
ncbi:MAG: proliferating cell nuclear antigen (pcna) [Thaumarchaeota archaeon]|jgi:proliferating cell nuclear antigen|nr:proliferating cell nuclear antigen (pcna) [Nitrososphaerota archaeon]|tara:strand:+ start:821 stop:1567 length:747 start_codon:yes stop_codon:yes gene_type:complete